MMMMMMISMVAFLILATDEVGGLMIVSPENAAFVSGSQVTLRCRTDNNSNVIWKIHRRNSFGSKIVFTGVKIATDFNTSHTISTSADQKEFNLSFKAARETAAIYSCEEPGGIPVSAEVIVIDSEPKCSVQSDWLKCSVDFWGNWVPAMHWEMIIGIGTARKVNITIAKGVEVNEVTQNDRLTSTLSLGDNRPTGHDIGYTCTLRFTESNRPEHLTAKNVPTYSYTWKNYHEETPIIGTAADGSSNGKTQTTAIIVCLVVVMMIVAALFVYVVQTKRKQTKASDDGRRRRASEDAAAAVELSDLPRRTSAVESEYVGLPPVKDRRCPPAQVQRLTCSGDYSTLRNDEEYAKLDVYAVLDVV